MIQTLLVKHAVSGRIFIDSSQETVEYEVMPNGEGWLLSIAIPWQSKLEELMLVKEELNVFIFYQAPNEPTLKTWYYVKEGPVQYDHLHSRLLIHTQSKIEYYPHEYSY